MRQIRPSSMPAPVRLALRGLLVGAFALLLVCARGWVSARVQGGRYPLSSAPLDAAALLLLACGVFAINRVLFVLAARLSRTWRPWPRRAMTAVRLLTLFALAAPMVFAAVQIHPQRVVDRGNPASVGLASEEVRFESDGLTLSGWSIPAAAPGAPIVLVAHGLGGSRADALYPALLLHRQGFAVFTFDFRAHGESEGFVTTLGEREARDVAAARALLERRHPSVPVHALGYSMGASAVLRAVGDGVRFERVVADSGYARMESVARAGPLRPLGPAAEVGWQALRLWGLVLTGFDLAAHQPEDLLAGLGERLLLVHGKADRTIPFGESQRLQRAAGEGAALWLVDGAGHVGAMAEEGYGERLAAFLNGERASGLFRSQEGPGTGAAELCAGTPDGCVQHGQQLRTP